MNQKKIAIFHNFMDNIGGAELVTLNLAKNLNADIYTTDYNLEKIEQMGFENIKIFSLGKIPFKMPFKHQIAFFKFRRLNLKKKYDFYIVSGEWAMSGLVNNKPNLWYIHGPLNEIWEFRDYIKKNLLKPWQVFPYEIWAMFNRFLSKKYIKHSKKLVCNSQNTQSRIKKYFKREARIICPSINTKEYCHNKPKDYWLSVNRLSPPKRVEMQVKAFLGLPNEKLIIVGSFDKNSDLSKAYQNHLIELGSKNIEFKSGLGFQELRSLFANSKGFITTAENEDFGITPVEAMASGKPVIAGNEGGYKETIINEKTGILIDNINSDKLAKEIRKMSKELEQNSDKYKKACQEQAKKFDTQEFIKKIKEEIEK
jgi:glycosyltransferase involved in cell wall biosynthesis